MSQALRKLTATIKKTNCMVIFINQIRMKIGVMFGSPETTTGGNALKFYASVRLDIRRIGSIKKGEEVIGSETKVKVVKNKVARPSRRPSSTSCTAKASAARARSSTWAWPPTSSKSRAPGTPTTARRMKIHEYQGKEMLRQFGVPVPRGYPAFTVCEAVEAAQKTRRPRLGGQGADPRRRPRQGRRRQARAVASTRCQARAPARSWACSSSHPPDRPRRPEGAPPLHRRRRRHPEGVLRVGA
jgi:hypothetical protein